MFVSNAPMISSSNFGSMLDSNSLMDSIRNAGSGGDLKAMQNREKQTVNDKIRNQISGLAYETGEKPKKALEERNIERNFSVLG